MSKPGHVNQNPTISEQTRPPWIARGAIFRHTCPRTQQLTLFVLHRLQQLRGAQAIYLLSSEGTERRYPLETCHAATWADFSTLQTLQVRNEPWLITHPQQQLTETVDPEGKPVYLSLSESYVAALELAEYFDGIVLLPPDESLAGTTERLTAQWTVEP